MSKHTPEPWTTEGSNGIYLKLPNGDTHSFPIIWSEKAGMDVAYIVPMDDTKRADADRIVACVNALAGLNPEAVQDVVEALRGILREIEYCVDDGSFERGIVDANVGIIAARAALAKLEGKG